MHHVIERLEPRRLFDAGHPDPTFGSGGHTSLTGQTNAVDLDVTPQNQILVTTHGTADLHISHLTQDGVIDHAFGPAANGVLSVPITQATTEFGLIDPSLQTAVGPDGSIFVLVGNLLYKYKPNGLRDNSFGKHGRAIVHAFAALDAKQVTIDEQGRAYILGADAKNNLQIVCLATNGKPDLSFAVQSVLTPHGGISLDITNMLPEFTARTLADGSMLFVAVAKGTLPSGEFTEPAFDLVEVKLTKNGALARSFGKHGLAIHSFTNTDIDTFQPGTPSITPDGSLFITVEDDFDGNVTEDPTLESYAPDGSASTLQYDSVIFSEGLVFDGGLMAAIELEDRALPDGLLTDQQVIFHDAVGASIDSANTALKSELAGFFPLQIAQQNDGSIVVLSEPAGDATDHTLRLDRFDRDDSPAAQLNAKTLTKPQATSYRFSTTYRDDDGVSLATLGNDDITVLFPDGTTHRASLVAADTTTTNAKSITATYRVAAPPGGWTAASNRNYQIKVNKRTIRDIHGNPTGPRIIGAFQVQIN